MRCISTWTTWRVESKDLALGPYPTTVLPCPGVRTAGRLTVTFRWTTRQGRQHRRTVVSTSHLAVFLHIPDRSTLRKESKMVSVTLSSKFQLSIPKAIREEMQLHAGQRFAIIPKGDTIVLAPIRRLDEVRGLLKGADPSRYRDRDERLDRYE